MSKPKQWKQGRELKHADAWQGAHYPEEWGPSNNRQLTCVCGNPDPGHVYERPAFRNCPHCGCYTNAAVLRCCDRAAYPQEAEQPDRLWVGSGDSQ